MIADNKQPIDMSQSQNMIFMYQYQPQMQQMGQLQ